MRRATLALLPMALLTLQARGAFDPAAAAPDSPAPLGDTASAPAHIATPETTPLVVPEPRGTIEVPEGATTRRVEDKVASGKPTAYRFVAPAGTMITIGVSSPKGNVRISIYEGGSAKPLSGSEPENGAIRLTTQYPQNTELILVAHTVGEETPFRFDVSLSAGSM